MFSTEQLKLIEKAARSVKNQGELAVARKLQVIGHWDNRIPASETYDFTDEQLNVIEYCAAECKRQHSGELSVYWMVNAWEYAHNLYNGQAYPSIDLNKIAKMGMLVEPNKNIVRKDDGYSFRRVGVRVGMDIKPHWERVIPQLTLLLEAYYDGALNPTHLTLTGNDDYRNHPLGRTGEDEFYYQYEMIHPFVDGNGRTGKILYNYLLGRLNDPVMPPDFFGHGVP